MKTITRLFNDDNRQPQYVEKNKGIGICPKTASGKHIWQPYAMSHDDTVYERCIACGLFNF